MASDAKIEAGVRLLLALPRGLVDGRTPPLAIEVDGHDFHERTRAQAQRDKLRDRWLQARGWRVLRFTGSEIIYRDAAAAADEVLGMLVEDVNTLFAREGG